MVDNNENIWPGKSIVFACWARMGRSVLAKNIMRRDYPHVRSNSLAICNDYVLRNAWTHSLTIRTLIERGHCDVWGGPVVALTEGIERMLITSETDLVLLIADPGILQIYVPRRIIDMARTTVAYHLQDPSIPVPGQRHSLRKSLWDAYDDLTELIHGDLPVVLRQAHENENNKKEILYPWGTHVM